MTASGFVTVPMWDRIAPSDIVSVTAIRYIEAAGQKNYAAMNEMLAADVSFKGAAFET